MIICFTRRAHAYTVRDFIGVWAADLRQRVQVLPYEDLAGRRSLPPATYVFADLERLSPALTDLAADVWDRLAAASQKCRLLNHPRVSLRRFELQQALRRRGRSRFAVHRLTDPPEAWRFPVFLRRESEHSGSLTPLLRSVGEVRSAASRQVARGIDPRDLLVTEFCDTADADGVYRRYAVLRLGDRFIPDSLSFSRNWMVKYSENLEGGHLDEELRFLERNPHEDELRAIFALAGIEYGRIDYALLGGEIVVWEINTNPFFLYPTDRYDPEKLPDEELYSRKLKAAFESLDVPAADGQPNISIHVAPEVIRRLWPSPVARLCRFGRVADDPAAGSMRIGPEVIRRPLAWLWRGVRRWRKRVRRSPPRSVAGPQPRQKTQPSPPRAGTRSPDTIEEHS